MGQQQIPTFHAFTVKYGEVVARLITELDIAPAFDPAAPPSPLPRGCHTLALWDTGATRSVITARTAVDLGLKPVGAVMVNHAGGSSGSSTYLVNFGLPNKVTAAGVLVTECPGIADGVGAIIGMDIIAQGDFAVTNTDSQTWMSYRVPSIEPIDYVKTAQLLKRRNVGRNDPCPCGKSDASGRPMKYKKCCGKAA